jgi:hypothetical protein
MKTLTATLQPSQKLRSATREKWLSFVTASARDVVTLSIAAMTTAMVITLSVWAAAMGANPMLGAGTWAMGFIFLGLAVDRRGLSAHLHTATGAALPVLALLQDRVSPDFMIVSGVLLAAWAGFIVLQLFSVQEIQ